MLEAYGVWAQKSMYGRTYMGINRTTFLIGANGRIATVWPKVKVAATPRRSSQPPRRCDGTPVRRHRRPLSDRPHFQKINHAMVHSGSHRRFKCMEPVPERPCRLGLPIPPLPMRAPILLSGITVTSTATAGHQPIKLIPRGIMRATAANRTAPSAGRPSIRRRIARRRTPWATRAARSASVRWRSGRWSARS